MKTNVHFRPYFRGYLSKLEGVRQQKIWETLLQNYIRLLAERHTLKGLIFTFSHIS